VVLGAFFRGQNDGRGAAIICTRVSDSKYIRGLCRADFRDVIEFRRNRSENNSAQVSGCGLVAAFKYLRRERN